MIKTCEPGAPWAPDRRWGDRPVLPLPLLASICRACTFKNYFRSIWLTTLRNQADTEHDVGAAFAACRPGKQGEPGARVGGSSQPGKPDEKPAPSPCRWFARCRAGNGRKPRGERGLMEMIADWSRLAACRDGDPDALFVQGAEQNIAKRICRGC